MPCYIIFVADFETQKLLTETNTHVTLIKSLIKDKTNGGVAQLARAYGSYP
jgi:hypothetical protein